MWTITENTFKPDQQNNKETIYTIGNGYMGSRGTFEEAYPGEVRSTFIHGVFDNVPVVFTELVNAPDWMELEIILAGERFRLDQGELLDYTRTLDLKTACLRRDLRWRSPRGHETRLVFERFTSLADRHLCALRVNLTPENYTGRIEVRSGLNGEADNLGVKHWDWLGQELRGNTAWLHSRTRATQVELVIGERLIIRSPGHRTRLARWGLRNHPTLVAFTEAGIGETVTGIKWVTYHTSREGREPLKSCLRDLRSMARLEWEMAWEAHCQAWNAEWEQCDVVIEGDEDAQLALRFNLFQLLAAAPRRDERVNIGAKTLSGYGYRGHAFWDTEIFMLPFFTYTRPEIARDLLSYRWHNLAGAHEKALANGYRGAQYPWESAGTGEEVTPAWVPDPLDRTKIIRIWGGDIEIHISADISYAIWQYWQATGDRAFLLERGAEIILDTARFWGSRVEWNPDRQRFEIHDIIGPDEYHDRVDNNIFTNAMARWNLQTALELAAWMKETHPVDWRRLNQRLQLKDDEFRHWKEVIDRIYLAFDPMTKLIEQFEGYFQRKDIDLETLEPRTESLQALFGIEGINATQVIKQPDVLMLMYLLPGLYDDETLRVNYAYYTARTDHTFGSSLGPSIQAIMACRVDDPSSYQHFMRAAHADLFDVRNNAGDGIHGASAGGLWQAVVFGFAGLEHTSKGWQVHPRLPKNWTRLAFRIVDHGHVIKFDIKP